MQFTHIVFFVAALSKYAMAERPAIILDSEKLTKVQSNELPEDAGFFSDDENDEVENVVQENNELIEIGDTVVDILNSGNESQQGKQSEKYVTRSLRKARGQMMQMHTGQISSKVVRDQKHKVPSKGSRPRRRMYFPDWAEISGCKVDEGDAPNYMRSDPRAFMERTLAGCCKRYFGWKFEECLQPSDEISFSSSRVENENEKSDNSPRHDTQGPPSRRLQQRLRGSILQREYVQTE